MFGLVFEEKLKVSKKEKNENFKEMNLGEIFSEGKSDSPSFILSGSDDNLGKIRIFDF